MALLKPTAAPGDVVVRIAGEAVFNGTPLDRFFNGAENRSLPIVVRSPTGMETVLELKCISYPRVRALILAEDEERARQRTAKSRAKLVWVPVRDMNRTSYEKLKLVVHRASEADAMILDLRGNIGGRETDRMLSLFCQPIHSFTIPRDGPRGYPADRRIAPSWDKPLVVLCNQDTFSNGEIFCHAIRHIKRASLIGTPTAGGVISAVKRSIPDVGTLQIPFRGWFHIESGKNFDEEGAQPDFLIPLGPGDEVAGSDPQLDKAIEILEFPD